MLIVTGLFLKVVIANHLATHIVDEVFAAPNRHSSLEVLVGVYAYAVQIFADFCGYTNIAIGIALLLGFEFPQNFNSPYTAVTLQDFWRRWHMTLSRWLRDYLYIPLGGNRKGTLVTYRNLCTMLLGGLWHGAAWTFVAWGAIHGLGLCVERACTGSRPRRGALVRPDTHVPHRLLRLDLLPRRLVRARVAGARAALHGVGTAFAARHDVGRARNRRRDRRPVPAAELLGGLSSASGACRRRPGGVRALRCSSSTPSAPRASRPSSTSASDEFFSTAAARGVLVLALGLAFAALLDARGLRKQAQIQPAGTERNIALEVTRPLVGVSARCT